MANPDEKVDYDYSEKLKITLCVPIDSEADGADLNTIRITNG